MTKEERKKYFNKTELKKRFWTDIFIEKLLIEADKEIRNPFYNNAPNQKLYLKNRVYGKERTKIFKEFKLKKQNIKKQIITIKNPKKEIFKDKIIIGEYFFEEEKIGYEYIPKEIINEIKNEEKINNTNLNYLYNFYSIKYFNKKIKGKIEIIDERKNSKQLTTKIQQKEIQIPKKIIEENNIEIKLITGETGSGKTYKAIKEATEKGKFIIAVPTRQLAYEIYMDYNKTGNIKEIRTGEISIRNEEANKVIVYENLNLKISKGIKTLIIDEAHFLNDFQRGGFLLNILFEIIKQNPKINILLLTATNTINEKLIKELKIKKEKIKAREKIKKIKIQTEKKLKELIEKEKDLKILIFVKYTPDDFTIKYYKEKFKFKKEEIEIISANIPTSKRVLIQKRFKEGKIKVLISTNVLAQGINSPADIVIIETNEWDSPEIINQKIGRSGRPGYNKKESYYYVLNKPNLKKGKEIKEVKEEIEKCYIRPSGELLDIEKYNLQKFQIPKWNKQNKQIEAYYENFKYAKKLFEILLKEKIELEETEKQAFKFLLKEEEKLVKILKENV